MKPGAILALIAGIALIIFPVGMISRYSQDPTKTVVVKGVAYTFDVILIAIGVGVTWASIQALRNRT